MNAAFKKQVVDELGLGAMSPAEQDAALESLGMLVFRSVLVRAMEELEPADRDQLATFMESDAPDGEAVMKFLNEKLHNLGEIVGEEAKRIKEETASVMKGDA